MSKLRRDEVADALEELAADRQEAQETVEWDRPWNEPRAAIAGGEEDFLPHDSGSETATDSETEWPLMTRWLSFQPRNLTVEPTMIV